ncbi:MAG: hypothetical protein ACM3XP_04270 [Nitrososphaerales archaeon]
MIIVIIISVTDIYGQTKEITFLDRYSENTAILEFISIYDIMSFP